jgi:sulfotransferase
MGIKERWMSKKIRFISGLPRSGSTLLCNILFQNPNFYVTPTSGLINQVIGLRNSWDEDEAFKAIDYDLSQEIKFNTIKGLMQGYFKHTDAEVCFDKNRGWTTYTELLGNVMDDVKIIVCVRDIRDILASFEKLYRKTSGVRPTPLDKTDPVKSKTELGRIEILLGNDNIVGTAYNSIKDCVARGWGKNLIFVPYGSLTINPKQTMRQIYNFIEEPEFDHDFNNVEQKTIEDDSFHGYLKDGLHTIRSKVEPQTQQWDKIYSKETIVSPLWTEITKDAFFWKDL